MTREEIINSLSYQASKASVEWYNTHPNGCLTEAFEDGFEAGAQWQKEQDEKDISDQLFVAHLQGVEHAKKIFEKNSFEAYDKMSKEQDDLEQDFVVSHIEKHNCTPTFIDAIEFGMKKQKEQMMKDVAIAKCFSIAKCFGKQNDKALFSIHLPAENYSVGSEVKVIILPAE